MNRQGWMVVAAIAVLGMTGCAGQPPRYGMLPQSNEVDQGKVVAVNEWANSHGAVIRWVNMPVKKKDAGAN